MSKGKVPGKRVYVRGTALCACERKRLQKVMHKGSLPSCLHNSPPSCVCVSVFMCACVCVCMCVCVCVCASKELCMRGPSKLPAHNTNHATATRQPHPSAHLLMDLMLSLSSV